MTHYNANQLMQIIPIMSGFAPGGVPLNPMRRLSPPRAQNPAQLRSFAEYIASINLSSGSWKYPLKTHPRPTGRATHAIITEYDLPRGLAAPHDVILDGTGNAWYSDFGAQAIGEVDPRTGTVTEYPVPTLKPGYPAGSLDLEMDKDGNIWIGMLLQERHREVRHQRRRRSRPTRCRRTSTTTLPRSRWSIRCRTAK